MKFAALALLAAVLFSDEAEARLRGGRRGKGRGRGGKKNAVSAECIVEAASEGDTEGKFKLYQRADKEGNVKPISVHGKFAFAEEADNAVDWSIQFWDDASCSGS